MSVSTDLGIAFRQTLSQSLELDPEGIKELATRIKQAVASLVDVDTIIADTKDDLDRVTQLKDRANIAKYDLIVHFANHF